MVLQHIILMAGLLVLSVCDLQTDPGFGTRMNA